MAVPFSRSSWRFLIHAWISDGHRLRLETLFWFEVFGLLPKLVEFRRIGRSNRLCLVLDGFIQVAISYFFRRDSLRFRNSATERFAEFVDSLLLCDALTDRERVALLDVHIQFAGQVIGCNRLPLKRCKEGLQLIEVRLRDRIEAMVMAASASGPEEVSLELAFQRLTTRAGSNRQQHHNGEDSGAHSGQVIPPVGSHL